MAINFSRLGTRVGHIIASLNEANAYRGTTLQTRATTIYADYTSVNPSLVTSIFQQRDAATSTFASWITYLSTLLSSVVVQEVVNDRPLASPTLSNALVELKRQMVAGSASFESSPCTIGSVTDIGTPTSNTQFVKTAKDGTGVVQDLIVPDVYLIVVTGDVGRGGTAYSETLTLTGKPADPAATDYGYPSGTSITTTITLIDPAKAVGVVTDPSFALWTVTNTPDSWTVSVGTVGTNVFKVLDDPRDGAAGSALRLVSTAGTTYKLRQAVTLAANTVYGVHFKYKPVANGSATAASVVAAVRLVDGSGSVIADDASTNNSLAGATHAVVTTGSGWNHGTSGVFITPTTLPTAVYLEITFTADATGAEGYVDHVNLKALSPLYTGGPYIAAFSGKSLAVFNDSWTWTISLTTGAVADYVIRGLDRLLGLKSLGVRLPTNSSPTIEDTVIV